MAERVKRVVLRRCAACGEQLPKRDLIRIVRTPEGRVEVDSTGKASGRGTYLCPKTECWEKGLAKNRLDRVLRSDLLSEDKEALHSYHRKHFEAAAVGGSR
jgi:hypothetical protein